MSQYPYDPNTGYPNQPTGQPGQPGQQYPNQGYPAQPYPNQGYPAQPAGGAYQPGYYAPYPGYAAPPQQSGLGVASFIMGCISGVGLVITIGLAASKTLNSPGRRMDPQSPEAITLGCCIFAALGLCLLGTVLSVINLCQRDRKKAFGVLGLIINGGMLLLVAILMVIGLAAG